MGTHSGTVGPGTIVIISGISANVGTTTVYAGVVDTAGNVGCYGTAGHTYTRSAPVAVTTPTLTLTTDSGVSVSDGVTNDVSSFRAYCSGWRTS